MSFTEQARLIATSRRKQNLTQRAIGEALGHTSAQFISNIERGQAALPEKDLFKVSQLLKINRKRFYNAILRDRSKSLQEALKLRIGR